MCPENITIIVYLLLSDVDDGSVLEHALYK